MDIASIINEVIINLDEVVKNFYANYEQYNAAYNEYLTHLDLFESSLDKIDKVECNVINNDSFEITKVIPASEEQAYRANYEKLYTFRNKFSHETFIKLIDDNQTIAQHSNDSQLKMDVKAKLAECADKDNSTLLRHRRLM